MTGFPALSAHVLVGRDDDEGVVDPWGRVYNHPGLHIADGSVMPGPVGPNPSLTIAGLADRFADAADVAGDPDRSTARGKEPRPAGDAHLGRLGGHATPPVVATARVEGVDVAEILVRLKV